MAYEIIWSNQSKEDYHTIISSLLDAGLDSFAEKFTDETSKVVDLLSTQPYLGMASTRITALRKINIINRFALYYTVVSPQVIVLNLIDNRQNRNENF